MRAMIPAMVACVATVGGTVEAQYVPQTSAPRWTIGPAHASTAAESLARGLADLVRARGQAAVDYSAAAVNLAAARRMEIENRKEWAKNCLEIQRIRQEARQAARGRALSQEDLARIARQRCPERLSPAELHPATGQLHWPPLLQTEAFAPQRKMLEQAFARRVAGRGLSAADLTAVEQATQAMLARLQGQIRQVAAADYVAARAFLASLAYECRRPRG